MAEIHKPPLHAVGCSRIKYPCGPLILLRPISFDHQYAVFPKSLTINLVTHAGRCSAERNAAPGNLRKFPPWTASRRKAFLSALLSRILTVDTKIRDARRVLIEQRQSRCHFLCGVDGLEQAAQSAWPMRPAHWDQGSVISLANHSGLMMRP